MKKLLALLVLFASPLAAQDFIRFYPSNGLQASGTGWTLGTPPVNWSLDASGNLYPNASTQTLGLTTKPVGRILLANGVVGTPSFSFASDPDTGFYWSSDGIVQITTNGAYRYAFGPNGFFIYNDGGYLAFGAVSDLFLRREAANHLILRNGATAQTFSLANTYTDASNYEAGGFKWNANLLEIFTSAAGTGTTRNLYLKPASGYTSSLNLAPNTTNAYDFGVTTALWRTLYLSHGIQGARSKVLTAASAISFVSIAVPQTAGANYAGGEAIWTVFFADATDQQVLQGRTRFAAANKAGTESCSVTGVGTDTLVASDTPGKDDLACTITCVVGLVDLFQLAANCASVEMTETTLTIQYRLDMTQPNTVTPL